MIVDGKDIYELKKGMPLVIEVFAETCSIILTDGFHHSNSLIINFNNSAVRRFKISSILDNQRIIFITAITIFFFILAFLNELFWLKIVSFLPLLLFLHLYYIKRNSFFLLEVF
ncbi:MAG: hypothetical protein ABUT20_65185 [Bacteroidota bacterium]